MHGLLKTPGASPTTSTSATRSGLGHFRTPVEKGLEIIAALRGHTTGYAVPHFVVDAPGRRRQDPLLPEYLVGREGDELLLRNFEGSVFRYPTRLSARAGGERRRASMRVGLVYDLRADYRGHGLSGEVETAEFDSPETIDALERALRAHRPQRRAHRQRPSPRRAARRAATAGTWCSTSPRAWRAARARPRCRRCSRPYDVPYTFSDALVMALTLDKGDGEARRARLPACRPPRSRSSAASATSRPSTCPTRSSPSRSPRARARASAPRSKAAERRRARRGLRASC